MNRQSQTTTPVETPFTTLDEVLTQCSALDPERSLDDLPDMARELAQIIGRRTATVLSPDAGVDTLFAIDTLVAKLERADGAHRTSRVALGLIGLQTLRLLAEEGRPVHSSGDGAATLSAVDGFPDLSIGGVVVPVGSRLCEDSQHRPSLVDAWAQIEVVREPPVVDTQEGPQVHFEPELLRLASLAPYAGFLLVAVADGTVEESEFTAFCDGMKTIDSDLVRRVVIHCPLDGSECLSRLMENPDLAGRALAALGAVCDRSPDGESAKRALVRILVDVAFANSNEGPEEKQALAVVVDFMRRGEDFAKAGPNPFEGQYDYEAASMAPLAAFLAVAAADGELEEKELSAFAIASNKVSNPLLCRLLALSNSEMESNFQRLLEDPERASASIRAAGKLFETHPDGPAAKDAFMAMLRNVAAVHGEIRSDEARALRAVEHMLEGTEPVIWPFLMVLLGGVSTVVVGAWLGLAALSGAAYALPIALGIQALVFLVGLALFRGQSGAAQAITGIGASLGTAVALALWTAVLGALFTTVPPVGATLGAVGGLGLLLTVPLAAVFRS